MHSILHQLQHLHQSLLTRYKLHNSLILSNLYLSTFKMQFTLASILALAAAVTAAPAPGLPILGGGDDEPRGRGPKGGDTTTTTNTNKICSVENQQVCCNGLLACAVQVLGENCEGGNAYCCNTGAATVSVSFTILKSFFTNISRAL